MINKPLTDKELEELLAASQANYEAQLDLGSDDVVKECSLIVKALTELQERRKSDG